jgi:hypothetical protein
LGLQVAGTQIIVAPDLHWPMPLHCPPLTTASPSQLPPLQTVPAGQFRQAPRPSHLPSSKQLDESAASHAPLLLAPGLAPVGRLVQVPSEPVPAQVLQASVQAVEQQTPSAQKLLAHSDAQVQLWPASLPPLVAGQLTSGPAST